jgi:endonuclease/exonuclease/phosphatase family metal-dependent hydrolase
MCARAFWLALAAAVLPAAAAAQSFDLLTQNVLRFGHGSRLLNQCNAITAVSANVDIIVLQEVMTDGYPCLAANNSKNVNVPIPPDFGYATSAAKGRSSYREYYGVLYRTNVRNDMQIVKLADDDNLSTTATFMRPPYAVQFEVKDTKSSKACKVWITDLHSIFGKKLSERQEEAAAMRAVYLGLMAKNTGAVIVAGDWNLPADDTDGFTWVANNNAAIQPNVLTSLTATGVPSSAYDHAINTHNTVTAPSIKITHPSNGWTYFGTGTMADWRKDVSDHMGVMAKVALTC